MRTREKTSERSSTYPKAGLVCVSCDVVCEHLPHVLFTVQLVSPHVQQVILGRTDLQVEQVVVLKLAERGRRRIAPPSVRELVPVGGTVHVALWSGVPEDGPHVLLAAVVVGGRLPWQRSSRFLTPHPQPLQDLDGGHLTVQGVEVDAGDAARVEECAADLDALLDAIVPDRLVIVLDRVDGVDHFLRHLQLGQFADVAQRLVGLYQGEKKGSRLHHLLQRV